MAEPGVDRGVPQPLIDLGRVEQFGQRPRPGPILTRILVVPTVAASVNHNRAPSPNARNAASDSMWALGIRPNVPAGELVVQRLLVVVVDEHETVALSQIAVGAEDELVARAIADPDRGVNPRPDLHSLEQGAALGARRTPAVRSSALSPSRFELATVACLASRCMHRTPLPPRMHQRWAAGGVCGAGP